MSPAKKTSFSDFREMEVFSLERATNLPHRQAGGDYRLILEERTAGQRAPAVSIPAQA
jgi:hypothetical protein